MRETGVVAGGALREGRGVGMEGVTGVEVGMGGKDRDATWS